MYRILIEVKIRGIDPSNRCQNHQNPDSQKYHRKSDQRCRLRGNLIEPITALLINESVYMPLNHLLIPLEMDGRKLFSELWVDADAEDGKGGRGSGEKCMRILFKLDVQDVGLFDVILTSRDRDVDVVVACPEGVAPFSRQIEQTVSQILTRNDLNPGGISVRKMERPVTLTEVFPKIFEGKNSVNVKV